MWGPMGAGKSTFLKKFENMLKIMPEKESKKIRICKSYIDHYRENQPLIAAIIDKNLKTLYGLKVPIQDKIKSFFTIQKIVINYAIKQIKNAISSGIKVLIMHNGYYAQTNIFSHASRLKKLGLNNSDIAKYKELLQSSGWADLKEDYAISCDASLYDCYHRIAARKRAEKTGENILDFEAYRELNIGVIMRRPNIPIFKVDTSRGQADMGFLNALHNIMTYVVELGKLI